MTKACAEETGAVVVDRTRAVHDLVFSISIDVANAEIMITLTSPVGPWVRCASVTSVEYPTTGEHTIAPIPCGKHGASVVATRHHETRSLTIKIRNGTEKTINTISKWWSRISPGR